MSTKRFIAKHGLDNNNQTITNVADPLNSTDVAIKRTTDNLSNTINIVWSDANSGISIAQAAYDAANNVAPQIAPAHQKANAAYNTANNAWAAANTANTWLQANDAATLISSKLYSDSNDAITLAYAKANDYNTLIASYANDSSTLESSKIYTNLANTWLQENDNIILAASKNYSNIIYSSTSSIANNAWAGANASYIYASSTANNAYNTANSAWNAANTANTWLQANDAVTLASAKANDYNTLVAAYSNDSSTLTSSKSYTDNANTWLQENDVIILSTAKNYSNSIYSILSSTANNAYNTANNAWAGANAAYTYASSTANNAYNTANNAWNKANSSNTIASSAYNNANSAYDKANSVNNIASSAYNTGNGAYVVANSAWAGANASYTYASSTANNAYNTANNAWATANNKLNSSGGIISGNLAVSGNVQIDGTLSISGNVFSLQANNLSITDNMIYLNRGANTANPDIGIAAGYNDGSYHHTGFFRDATDGIWKVFDNYVPEPDESVYIDTSNSTFRIANFQANVVYGNTFISTMQTGIAPFSVTSTTIVPNLNVDYLDGNHGSYYSGLSNTVSDRANTLYSYSSSTANNAYNTANNAWAGANASYTYASSTANNAYNTANSAWAGANASYTYASSTANNAYITANNAWAAANTANTYRANASNLTTGTIPSAVLGNSTLYIGTTSIALNRASATQSLTGITSIDGSAATLTTTRTLWGQNFNGSGNVTGALSSVGDITGSGAVTLTATSGTLGLVATGANIITASTNGAEILRIDSAGNVGIGTNSPAGKLDVIANTTSSLVRCWNQNTSSTSNSVFRIGSSSTGANVAQLQLTEYNYYIATISADRTNGLNFYVGQQATPLASKRATLDINGNFGLGVTPSSWNGNSTSMQIGSLISIEYNTNGFVNFGYNFYRDSSGAFKFIQNGYASSSTQYNGAHFWYTSTTQGTAGAVWTPTQVMSLNASGVLSLYGNVASSNTTTGTLVVTGGVGISGALNATTKSFDIVHPSDPNKRLRYGSLESPSHSVRLTGRSIIINGKATIELPYYLRDLVHEEDVNIQLTNIKHGEIIWVDEINISENYFTVGCKDSRELEFFWDITCERKDVDRLVVEE